METEKRTICLVSLPSPFLMDDKVFPPLGILYVAAALRNDGHNVYVHDGSIKDIPHMGGYYGISATTPQFPLAIKALKRIKSYDSWNYVVIGGPHATVDPDSCLEAGFDGVVIGDGEIAGSIAFGLLTKRIECQSVKSWDKGRCYIHHYLPARDLINIHDYKYEIDGRPATTVMTSRGCPYSCAFCCKITKNVQIFSARHVISELQELKDKYGYTAFMFFDDVFIINRERFMMIAMWMKENNIIWRGFARADLIVKGGPGMVREMKDSGCVEVGIGVESGSDRILSAVNKGENAETIKKAIRLLKSAGIRVKGFFIVGLPGEDFESLKETEEFLEEVELDDVDFSIFVPFKGSRIYKFKHEYDIHFDTLELKNLWYKGKPGQYKSLVRTQALNETMIVKARNRLERMFKKWR